MLQKVDQFLTKNYLKTELEKKSKNVYLEADYCETLRCISAVQEIRKKIQTFHNEFLENNVLMEVLKSIDQFLNVPINVPLMRLASLLEKIIGIFWFFQKLKGKF